MTTHNQSPLLLDAITRVQAGFVPDADFSLIFDGLLTDLRLLTGSAQGFVAEVLHLPGDEPVLTLHAVRCVVTGDDWPELHTASVVKGAELRALFPLSDHAIRHAELVISNDLSTDPRRRHAASLPPGAFMGCPIRFQGEMVALVGVGGREGGYSAEMATELQPLLITVGQVVAARRNHRRMADQVAASDRMRAQLADSQQRLAEFTRHVEAFLAQTTDFIYFKDADSRFLFCSQSLARLTGHSHWKDMVGKHDSEVFPPDLAHIYITEEQPVFEQARPLIQKINPYRNERGEPGWVMTNKWPLLDDAGKVAGIFGISRDITERKQAEDKLRQSASVFEHANEAILITDVTGAIVDVNAAFTRITGYSREEVLGRNARMLGAGHHDAEFFRAVWAQVLQTGHWQGEIWNRHQSGATYAALSTISAVRNEQGALLHYVGLFSDVTSHRMHAQQLEQLAYFDLLTRLPNRALLSDRLAQAMARTLRSHMRMAVVYLDLDGFKAVNDTHGHETGDRLLMALARRMSLALRAQDTLARLGGDEFVALLTDLDQPATAEPVLHRLLAAAAQPVDIEGHTLRVSASAGVRFYPQGHEPPATDADQLVRQADRAMYQAKQAGRNRYRVFDPLTDAGSATAASEA